MKTQFTGLQWSEMLKSDLADKEVIRYRRDETMKMTVFTIGGDESDGEVMGTLGYERARIAHFDAQKSKTYSQWVSESLKNIYGGDTREIPM